MAPFPDDTTTSSGSGSVPPGAMTRRDAAIVDARASIEGGVATFRMDALQGMPRIEPQLWISAVGAIALAVVTLLGFLLLR